jgi:hypothetical protein
LDVIVKFLRKNPKTGILEFRHTFPDRLLPYVTDDSGKKITEVKRSFGVRSFEPARDGPAYQEWSRLYDRLAFRAEKVATGTYNVLDAPTIAYLAEMVRSEGLQLDEEIRFLREPRDRKVHRIQRLSEDSRDDLAECRQLRALGDVEGMVDMWGTEAFELAFCEGLYVDRNSDGFARLCVAVNDAQIDVWSGILSRSEGNVVPTPCPPLAPAAPTASSKARQKEKTFEKIALDLIEKRRVDFNEPTKERVRGALRFLIEAVGDLTPSELTRERVAVYLDLLAERPSKLPKEHFHRSLKELSTIYQGRTDVPRLVPKTIEAYCLALNARWKEAQSDGAIPEGQPSPFSGRKFSRKSSGPKAAKGFSKAELEAYFSMPAFTDNARPTRGKGEAIYWIPLLMMFTGARPEEVAQLLATDIFEHERDGKWVIRFTDEGMHPVTCAA